MSAHSFTHACLPALRRLAAVASLAGALLIAPVAALGQDNLQASGDPSSITLQVAGKTVAEYQCRPHPRKPYLKQLFSPKGVNVLRDAPADHLHHHGLMFAVAVDGVDFWAENEKCGRQNQVGLTGVRSVERRGLTWRTFTHEIDWVGPDAKTLLLKEQRTIDSCVMPEAGATSLIWQSRLEVPPGKQSVTLSGSAYFGLGMRFVQSMDTGGRFQNADGNSGVEGTGDVRSRWCAYSAVADGKPVTVAMFDCPGNARHPATWFTMDSRFAYLAATLNLSREPLVVEAGNPLTLRYAVALWDGHVEPETIEKLYRQLFDRSPLADKP